MKKDYTSLVIKLLFWTIIILGITYLILLAQYTFEGHGDIRNEMGRKVVQAIPETARVAFIGGIFIIYTFLIRYLSYLDFKNSRSDITSGEKVAYEKKINNYDYQVDLLKKESQGWQAEFGILYKQHKILNNDFYRYREYVRKEMIKISERTDLVLLYENYIEEPKDIK